MKIEEQKKAVRSGYDMDIIPSDLATFGSEAKNLLQDLQSRNERMFLLTFLVVNMADTKRKLDNDVFATAGFAQKNNCALTRLDYLQEAGFMSSIPLGENLIPIQRGLTTSSTAIFIPFITQELFQKGAALYYGLNALSNNMILCDRKQLKNPNGLILGTPGSGKSFAAKREMTNAFLITDDDIIICDPEAEYFSLVQRLGGQVIRLSPTHDIAAALGKAKTTEQTIVAFALETNDEEANAQRKLEKKNADFIVLNSLQNKGTCFRTDDNQIEIISRSDKKEYPKCSKAQTAVYIVDELERVVSSK